MVPALLLSAKRSGLRGALRAGVLLSSRLSLVIAAASVGLEEGLISKETKDAVVMLALITCLIGPSLFKMGQPAAQKRIGD